MMNEVGVPSSGVVHCMQWVLHAAQEDKWVTLLSDAFSFWCSKSFLFHCRSCQVTETRNMIKMVRETSCGRTKSRKGVIKFGV